MSSRILGLALVAASIVACQATSDPVPGQTGALRESAGAARPDAPLLTFLGDSLTAGFGLAADDAFPARLAAMLEERGHPVRLVNAGVSGDTSAGGLRRLDWLLRQDPAIVVVALGGNDLLRGLPPDETERNLRSIVRASREAGVRVLLLGLRVPPNYGPEYARAVEEIYPRIAADLEVPLVPFFLEGVGGRPELNLPDGIHPNAEGHRRIAENVLPYLEPLLPGGVGTGGG